MMRPGDPDAEDPCVGKGALAYIRETSGKPCPRVELEPENITLAQVALLVASQPEFILTRFAIDVELQEAPPWGRRSVIRRLIRVFSDGDVVELMNRRLKGNG